MGSLANILLKLMRQWIESHPQSEYYRVVVLHEAKMREAAEELKARGYISNYDIYYKENYLRWCVFYYGDALVDLPFPFQDKYIQLELGI